MLKLMQGVPIAGRRTLDVGCGSGVLALAAERLGAGDTLGIDLDYDAVSNARENLGLNEVQRPLRFEERDLNTVRGMWDVVLANLTGALLERSVPRFRELVAPEGHLIISGLTTSERGVIAAFESRFRLQTVDQEGEWLAAAFRP